MKHRIRKAPAGRETVEVELTRTTAIKAFCSECLGWETNPKDCPAALCPLYPFRGRTTLAWGRPPKKRSPEERAALRDRLAKACENRKSLLETPQDRSGDPGVGETT